MPVNNLGKQVTGILSNPGAVASAIAGGGIGLAGGAIMAGQQSEEMGASLSQQALSTVGGGVKTGVVGTAVGYGSGVALTAAKTILRKK